MKLRNLYVLIPFIVSTVSANAADMPDPFHDSSFFEMVAVMVGTLIFFAAIFGFFYLLERYRPKWIKAGVLTFSVLGLGFIYGLATGNEGLMLFTGILFFLMLMADFRDV